MQQGVNDAGGLGTRSARLPRPWLTVLLAVVLIAAVWGGVMRCGR